MKIRIATVFSGIGSIEFALKRMGADHEIIFACDNGERDDVEINVVEHMSAIKALKTIEEKHEYSEKLYASLTKKTNFVEKSYLANYECDKQKFYQDIRLLDGTDYKDKVDLFVGGSPCQSFSSVGHQLGLEDTRGTLFYDFARLIKEIEPKVFIYENVRNLLNHDKGRTWQVINDVFHQLGYCVSYSVLDAADYGIPQHRRRLFVVGYKTKDKFFEFPNKKELAYKMSDFLLDNCAIGHFSHDNNGALIIDKIPGEVDDSYILTPLLYNYVMKGGTKTWFQKPEINKPIARTLLKTMGNRHRAGVDNYVSNDGSDELGKVRMLSEREAHRLMGYTDDYQIVVSKAQAYKQAGNSIVVDVMMAIVKQMINDKVFEEE